MSVTEEYKMVDTKPEVVLLDFTPIESAIYETLVHSSRQRYSRGSQKDPVRELCCKLNYDWGSTLEDMREIMIKTKMSEIEQQKARIEHHKQSKISKENQLKEARYQTDFWFVQTANAFLADYQKKLEEFEKLLLELERFLKLFQDIVSILLLLTTSLMSWSTETSRHIKNQIRKWLNLEI